MTKKQIQRMSELLNMKKSLLDESKRQELNKLLTEATSAMNNNVNDEDGEKARVPQGDSNMPTPSVPQTPTVLGGSHGQEGSFEAQQAALAVKGNANAGAMTNNGEGEKERVPQGDSNQGEVLTSPKPTKYLPHGDRDGEHDWVKQGSSDIPQPGLTEKDVKLKKETVDFLNDTIEEGQRDKFISLFKAAVAATAQEYISPVCESYRKQINEHLAKQRTALAEEVDGYMGLVVEEWFNKNKIAIDNGITNEISDSFMAGLKQLFEEHHIEMPESKRDVVKDLTKKVSTLTEQLDAQMKTNVKLNKKLQTIGKKDILNETVKKFNLSDAKAQKVVSICESIDYTNDKEYREKIEYVIKEMTKSSTKPSQSDVIINESADATISGPAASAPNKFMDRVSSILEKMNKD